LTPAYAFTDYKSQGQTMECVIVDIVKPPSGGLTPFNAYVTISRSRGRDTISVSGTGTPVLSLILLPLF
ncbi:hypothetical protein EDB89DRAFT_1853550, partial [Lactarius sanguifluus]